MCKWLGPKTAVDIIHQCLLTHGHYGWSLDLPHQQRLRDVMGLEIGDGTASDHEAHYSARNAQATRALIRQRGATDAAIPEENYRDSRSQTCETPCRDDCRRPLARQNPSRPS